MIIAGGIVPAARIEEWADSAELGQHLIYAEGGPLVQREPGFREAITAARLQYETGRFELSQRKSEGRYQYVMRRVAKRRREEQTKTVVSAVQAAQALILEIIVEAARRDWPCPTNAELAARVGLPNAAAASYAVKKHVSAGRIRVELMGPGMRRRVTDVASGRRTKAERE